jgi:hypothetical protein
LAHIEENAFSEFLVSGVFPRDVDALFPLLRSAHVIHALIALFRGGDEEVMIRLAVLREIAARTDAPEWTPHELEVHLAFIDSTKLGTVLKRLREHDLLLWDADRRLYQLSPVGRMVLSSLSNLLRFGQDDDELGFLASQVAASGAIGELNAETLAHLLARLAELEEFFAQAVQSGSEFRLKAAQSRLASVWKWMEKGTDILKNLPEQGFSDEAWQLAQRIGQSQSHIMRMSSVFQNELAKIARQRVMLSDGGLSSSELAAWLKGLDVERLSGLAVLHEVPEPFFALPDVMLDQAEAFIERDIADKAESVMPPPVEVAQATAVAFEYPPQLAALTEMLSRLREPLPLADVVVGGDFSAASYRYSLLAFLGERNVDADLAVLAEQPCAMRYNETEDLQDIKRGEIARMTQGRIEPLHVAQAAPAVSNPTIED